MFVPKFSNILSVHIVQPCEQAIAFCGFSTQRLLRFQAEFLGIYCDHFELPGEVQFFHLFNEKI
jgi:hypothetical protein